MPENANYTMRKAVAVPYIIAILLGVAVIGLVGVWFVSSGGKLTKASVETECRTKALEFCTRSPTGTSPEWGAFIGNMQCDLNSLGIKAGPNDNRPDCSKVLK